MLHAFLGAMLAATSVGITARVLADAGALQMPAARIILGAAVIDDVLGLIVLAVVSGSSPPPPPAPRRARGGRCGSWSRRSLFLVGALVVGALLLPAAVPASRWRCHRAGSAGAVALGLCSCLLPGGAAGLAPIVGAFAAGLVLDEKHAAEHVARGRAAARGGGWHR